MTMRTATKYLTITSALLTLSGCVSNWDMQGHDPKDYYAKHPIANHLEARNDSVTVHFLRHETRLDADDAERLRAQLHGISPEAVDAIQFQYADDDKIYNDQRRAYLTKLLRGMGYRK